MSKRILVADDEPDILKLVARRVSGGGYTVITASEGNEALEKAQTEPFDLLVLDIMLPGIDGSDIAEQLRQNPRTAQIPIIFLTALVKGQETEYEGKSVGGYYFLGKPFDGDKLLALIGEVLDGAAPSANS